MVAWYFMLMSPGKAMDYLQLTNAGWIIPTSVTLGVVALSIAGAVCGTLLMRTLYKKAYFMNHYNLKNKSILYSPFYLS